MMKDERKTKDQLLKELLEARKKIAEVAINDERRSEFLQNIRKLIDSSPVPIIVSDKNQKILFLSSKFEELFGYDLQEIATLGDLWRMSYPDEPGTDQIEHWQGNILKAIQNDGDIDTIETNIICKDGAKRCIEFKFIGIADRCMIFCYDLTDSRRTEEELAQANERLKVWVCELEMQNNRMNLLRRMGEALHACRNIEDASPVIKQYGPQLFPKTSGSFYIFTDSKQKLHALVKWGGYSNPEILFTPDDCEAVRNGKPIEQNGTGCACSKGNWYRAGKYLCVPMTAAGEVHGLLHLGFHDDNAEYERGVKEMALVVTEQIALSLANLTLQETLRAQAIRDSLTGLFNRRYMEESLDREFHHAERRQHPVSIIMADIDHFKLFNDSHGHDAGDILLKLLSAILQKSIRKEDIVCRFGGEEFILIMPDMPLDVAVQRADLLREAMQTSHFDYHGRELGCVTISLGVAAFPAHGKDAESVLRLADEALYRAKHNGRNRVEVAPIKKVR
jgi:diguanylate cyclase (GGDEF)-like protein/PAS domain S-box-containing protein